MEVLHGMVSMLLRIYLVVQITHKRLEVQPQVRGLVFGSNNSLMRTPSSPGPLSKSLAREHHVISHAAAVCQVRACRAHADVPGRYIGVTDRRCVRWRYHALLVGWVWACNQPKASFQSYFAIVCRFVCRTEGLSS